MLCLVIATKNFLGTWILWTMVLSDKLDKIRPLILMVQGEFVKIEPEE